MRGGLARLFLICLPFVSLPTMLAQETGQVCAQSFEDRDGDGTRGPDERSIAHGVSASLRNQAGLTIATRLLEDSPFAAEGILCFDDLPAGDYQINLRSAEFTSTTAAVFSASVSPGAAPALVEFGLQPLPAAAPRHETARDTFDAALVAAILRGLAGSLQSWSQELSIIALLSLLGLSSAAVRRRRRDQWARGKLNHDERDGALAPCSKAIVL